MEAMGGPEGRAYQEGYRVGRAGQPRTGAAGDVEWSRGYLAGLADRRRAAAQAMGENGTKRTSNALRQAIREWLVEEAIPPGSVQPQAVEALVRKLNVLMHTSKPALSIKPKEPEPEMPAIESNIDGGIVIRWHNLAVYSLKRDGSVDADWNALEDMKNRFLEGERGKHTMALALAASLWLARDSAPGPAPQ